MLSILTRLNSNLFINVLSLNAPLSNLLTFVPSKETLAKIMALKASPLMVSITQSMNRIFAALKGNVALGTLFTVTFWKVICEIKNQKSSCAQKFLINGNFGKFFEVLTVVAVNSGSLIISTENVFWTTSKLGTFFTSKSNNHENIDFFMMTRLQFSIIALSGLLRFRKECSSRIRVWQSWKKRRDKL